MSPPAVTGLQGPTGPEAGTGPGSGLVQVGGSASGVSRGLVLTLGSQRLALAADGAFVFPDRVAAGAPYEVGIAEQPACRLCTVANASGTAQDADVTNVQVACVVNAAPRVVFTDIESGPNTGGVDNAGAFITLYGESFGNERGDGRVTMGGVEVAAYVRWQANDGPRGLDRIVVQPGSNVPLGSAPIVVTRGGQSSEAIPFTIRTGQIRFAAADGVDTNDGSFAAPWSLLHARNTATAGTIVYLLPGAYVGAGCGGVASLCYDAGGSPSGTPSRPIAFVGFPGPMDGVLLGALTAAPTMSYSVMLHRPYLLLANVTVGTGQTANLLVGNESTRVVGVHAAALSTDDYAIWFGSMSTDHTRLLGLHTDGGVVFDACQNCEIAWSRLSRLMLTNTAAVVSGLQVHHNVFEPKNGESAVYMRLGSAMDNLEQHVVANARFLTNVFIATPPSNDPPRALVAWGASGDMLLRGNVFYGATALRFWPNPQGGAAHLVFDNNVVDPMGVGYISLTVRAGDSVALARNLWADSLSESRPLEDADPVLPPNIGFVDASVNDLRPTAQSSSIDVRTIGLEVEEARDFNAIPRPQGPAVDVGAFEYCAGP